VKLHNPLDDILSSTGKIRVLRVLFREPETARTGREVAGFSGVSVPQAIACLQDLENAGVVQRRVVGKAHEWKLVTENALIAPLAAIFASEKALPARLRKDLSGPLSRLGARRAVLFGSVARGEESDRSDIDLYVEVRTMRERETFEAGLMPLFLEISRRYGLSLSPYVLTSEEREHPPNPRLIQNVERDGLEILGG
jgi:predicted nucleotidyltransferase